MDMKAYIDTIKLQLTGGLLNLEIDDSYITQIVQMSLREIQRYIDTTELITIPFENCIDLKKYHVSAVTRVFRATGFLSGEPSDKGYVDPMQASLWQMLSSNGSIAGIRDFSYNYSSWNTLLQIRNTISTDLAHYYDKASEKLYINISTAQPKDITVEYIPMYKDVDDVTSAYWLDILLRMSVAYTKIALGRIRSRYTQSNALWQQDGQTMLDEGKAELEAIRQHLVDNTQLSYPID